MSHDPIRSRLAEHVRISGNFIPVCVVKLLPVVEAHFLSAGYALEPAMLD